MRGRLARVEDEGVARGVIARRLVAWRDVLWRSPYWAETLRAAGLSPRDLDGVEALAGFPALDRATLREHWRELAVVEDRELATRRSSGSAGDPVTVLEDGREAAHRRTLVRHFAAALGVELPPRWRSVLLCALPGRPERPGRISTLAPGALAALRRARPAVIASDPEGLHWLAAQEAPPAPRLVVTSAVYFSPAQRAAVAAVIPAPVVNAYSTTETGPIAWECLAAPGRFHVLCPDVWVESEGGELLVTRLRPGPLPLLRYRTGDAGEVARDACRCGFHGWTIAGFTGRRACVFRAPGGREVDAWRLAPLFKRYPLRAFRLAQAAPARFELDVVESAPAALGELGARVTAALGELGWRGADVSVRAVGELGAPAGTKPAPFVALPRSPAAAHRGPAEGREDRPGRPRPRAAPSDGAVAGV